MDVVIAGGPTRSTSGRVVLVHPDDRLGKSVKYEVMRGVETTRSRRGLTILMSRPVRGVTFPCRRPHVLPRVRNLGPPGFKFKVEW